MKKLLYIVPMFVIALLVLSQKASAQKGNQSDPNQPLLGANLSAIPTSTPQGDGRQGSTNFPEASNPEEIILPRSRSNETFYKDSKFHKRVLSPDIPIEPVKDLFSTESRQNIITYFPISISIG
ncbi:MAG: hypothetical protein V4541_12385 [Bacteroidota bacterium]